MERVFVPSTPRAGALPDPAAGLARVRLWLELWRERRALRGLDDRLVRDIGLDAAAVDREASRRPWDVPRARLGGL